MARVVFLQDSDNWEGALEETAQVICTGGVVILPTDTVYGIAASALDAEAIERLYLIKGREHTKSIAVLLGDLSQQMQVAAQFPEEARILGERFFPGALTLIVPEKAGLPANLSGNGKIGIRIPDHDFVRELIRRTGPLAVTSANFSGEAAACSLAELPAVLMAQADLLVDHGQTRGGVASTVVDCTVVPLAVLREGAIPISALSIGGEK